MRAPQQAAEKSFCYKRKNLKAGGDVSRRLGRAQTKSCLLLMGSPASIQSQLLPWHSSENMFANVSFVVCVWITRMDVASNLLVVANYHFQGFFYSFKVIKEFHQPFFTIQVGNEQSYTKKTSKHKFLLKSTQEPSTSTNFLTSAGNFWEATKHPK